MNVAFIFQPGETVEVPVHRGTSVAILTYQLARKLAGSNNVTVYAHRKKGQPSEQEDANGIRYRRLSPTPDFWVKPFRFAERWTGPITRRLPFYASRFYYSGYGAQIAQDLYDQPCDIVHIHNFSQFAPVIRKVLPHAKIALHMHCDWLVQLNRQVIKQRLQDVDLVLGCSRYITQRIRKRFPAFAHRCQTLYNGTHTQLSPPQTGSSSKLRILYVGRLSPEKGIHVLIQAFNWIAESHPNVHLDLVGRATLAPYEFIVSITNDPLVRDLARFYGSSLVNKLHKRILAPGQEYLTFLKNSLSSNARKRVTFHGFVPYNKLFDHYSRADVFVFPSVWHEPFGMPPVEAMARGLPVVATRAGGLPETVREEQTGLLVERNNPQVLARTLIRLLDQPGQRHLMGTTGRRYVLERFSWGQIAQKVEEQYKRLLSPELKAV